MKILHFLDTVNRGGAETLVLDVCRNARHNGLDVSFAHAGGGALEADFKNAGVPYFRLYRRLPFDPQLIYALRKIVRESEIDIVHTHQAVEALHALAATARTRAKVVLTHHGIVPDRKNLFATKFLLPRVAHNVLVGAASCKVYERDFGFRFPPATSVIYNGVDAKRLEPGGKNLRGELKIPNEAFLVGMIGNFYAERRKDQATLCRAMARVAAVNPSAVCIFAGRVFPDAHEKLEECERICRENKITENVRFLGARADVPDILAALDVFVCSSFAEGLPIAVNEAMLANVPTVLSDIEPLLEASQNGEFAEMFATGNDADLAEKVLKLLNNSEMRKRRRESAYDFARANFSIEAHLAKLKNLYADLNQPENRK